MKLSPKYSKVLVWLSGALLICTAVMVYFESELSRPWKEYQRQFVKLDDEITRQQVEKLEAQPDSEEKTDMLALLAKRQEGIDCRRTKIKQFWLTDFGTTDRCITCHQGVESPRFVDAPQPLTTHPGKHIDATRHPVDQYGCVICHRGQGVALTTSEAHAETAEWLDPILRGELAESSCRGCHPFDDKIPDHIDFPDAPHLTAGKRLYTEKKCMGCHLLKGFETPQRIGPILSRVAEKVNNSWLHKWISEPREYLPRTIMPYFDLEQSQVEKLGAFLNTLHKQESRQVELTGDADLGKKLVLEIGCLACHTIGETGGTFGPDLNRVAEKLKNSNWLLNWLDNPAGFDPETEMPDFHLSHGQIQDIAAYILTLKKQKTAPDRIFAPTLAADGKKLFSDLGCSGCHKVPGIEGILYGFPQSPEHTGFADKRMDMFDFGNVKMLSPEQIEQFKQSYGDKFDPQALQKMEKTRAAWTLQKLKTPRIYTTETIKLLMPDFELTDEEIRDLRVFLFSLREHEPPAQHRKPFWDREDPFLKGMGLVEKYNCTGCHKMGLTAKEIPIGTEEGIQEGYFWAAADYALEDIVVDDTVLYPRGTELSGQQGEDLIAAHPEVAQLVFRKNWFVDYDTEGYLMDFGLKSIKVLGMDEGDIMANYKDLNFAPPILHYEGAKVQANWLHGFLDNPYPVRPLTKATMPTFNFAPGDINNLVTFFTAKEGLDNPYFAVNELDAGQTGRAEEVFKICLQCHYFNQQRLLDKKGFADLKGPNLAEVKRRLRPEYIKQWVKFPDLILPGTQMKNFFFDFDIDNRFAEIAHDETGITDLSAKEKIEMMARFLMNPFKNKTLSIQR